ncbi:hypothetical protein M8R20_19620 [Pseudomonas sp. R2.Fl]|nr:hypothetical protein [Pseudomonas sp. R2.Fl]
MSPQIFRTEGIALPQFSRIKAVKAVFTMNSPFACTVKRGFSMLTGAEHE